MRNERLQLHAVALTVKHSYIILQITYFNILRNRLMFELYAKEIIILCFQIPAVVIVTRHARVKMNVVRKSSIFFIIKPMFSVPTIVYDTVALKTEHSSLRTYQQLTTF